MKFPIALFIMIAQFDGIAQSSISVDFVEYEKIQGLSQSELLTTFGIKAKATQAVGRVDSVTRESTFSHYISFTVVEGNYLVYLLKPTSSELDEFRVVDQFTMKSSLRMLYFNTLGCSPLRSFSFGNVFAIHGGNFGPSEEVKHFAVDDINDELVELESDTNYCRVNELMYTIRKK